MLTRKQIQLLAQRNGVPLHNEERNYIQTLFLQLLYMQTQNFIFKGGTCLRIVYDSNRYSEDLDFNSILGKKEGYTILEKVSQNLDLFGLKCFLKDLRESDTGFGVKLSYQGPLYDGRDVTKGLVRIDTSLRGEDIEETSTLIKPVYDDCRPFVIKTATLDHIMAEKVRALIIRKNSRDLYDIWFLLEKGITLNYDLINKKLKLYDRSFDLAIFKEIVLEIEKKWLRDLKPLMGVVPDFNLIKQAILKS
jgi:predicted nucleotidyltransferase component of viral defense system